MLEDAELDDSRSDKETKKFVDEQTGVKNSRYELRIPLKTGIEKLPDNRIMAEKRLYNLKKLA